ncbi:hypothetical protein NDU88_003218 [Pleurodeles waltl]|uniref:Uncharacterized protein n=1 Tax=Pleurodeles waltl TaxID=8319 RepID=A0AAV7TN15_PLEWA|nr:hypothetical protein NDU88_003218 [Pleurodeles waltl]
MNERSGDLMRTAKEGNKRMRRAEERERGREGRQVDDSMKRRTRAGDKGRRTNAKKRKQRYLERSRKITLGEKKIPGVGEEKEEGKSRARGERKREQKSRG